MPDFGNPFSGMDVDRKLNKEELIRAMRFVTAAEFEATQIYTQLADAIDDEGVQKVLRDVAKEEVVHAGEFMAVLKRLAPEEANLYDQGEKEVQDLISKEAIDVERLARYVRVPGKGGKPTLWYWEKPDGTRLLVDQKEASSSRLARYLSR